MGDSNVQERVGSEAQAGYSEPASGVAPVKARGKGIRIAGIVLLAGGLAAALWLLPVKQALLSFLDWSSRLGAWGPIVIAIAYIPACVLFLPGSVLTLGAGLVCGLVKGTLAVSIGSTLGASLAFLVGRTVARRWVEKRVSRNPGFQAIDAAVGEAGFRIVLLTRLSPVFPFNLLNYAYGLTRVSFRSYFLASWIGMLPGTILYVYLGSALKSLAEVAAGKVSGGWPQIVLFAAGLGATIGVTAYITRLARRALRGASRPASPA